MVYFVQMGENGPIKIGYTQRNSGFRKSSLQTGNPEELRTIGVILLAEKSREAALHEQFKAFRMKGEWFRPEEELLRFIRENTVPQEDWKTQTVPPPRPIGHRCTNKELMEIADSLAPHSEMWRDAVMSVIDTSEPDPDYPDDGTDD